MFRVSKGAPEAISSLPGIGQEAYEISDDLVVAQAKRGFKTLMVATTTNGGNDDDEDEQWDLIGCLSIIDPPRHDTKDTIDRAKAQGVQIKMITGESSNSKLPYRLGFEKRLACSLSTQAIKLK